MTEEPGSRSHRPTAPVAAQTPPPEPLQPEAETVVDGDQVHVSVPLPEVSDGALLHYVGSNLVVAWSRDDPEDQRIMVRLPIDVDPATHTARFANGVFDLTVTAARPAGPPHEPHPDSPEGAQ